MRGDDVVEIYAIGTGIRYVFRGIMKHGFLLLPHLALDFTTLLTELRVPMPTFMVSNNNSRLDLGLWINVLYFVQQVTDGDQLQTFRQFAVSSSGLSVSI